jgi:hypothetical protein
VDYAFPNPDDDLLTDPFARLRLSDPVGARARWGQKDRSIEKDVVKWVPDQQQAYKQAADQYNDNMVYVDEDENTSESDWDSDDDDDASSSSSSSSDDSDSDSDSASDDTDADEY